MEVPLPTATTPAATTPTDSTARPTWRRRLVLALSLLGIAFPILACSNEGGERSHADGGCPMGETCSPHTPQGLRFQSTPLSDTVGELPGIAAPGRMTIGFSPIGAYDLPDFSVDVGAGLEASDARRLDGDSGEVVVTGRAATDGSYLRVLASDESGLLDRISLVAHEVASRGLRPYVGLLQSLGGPYDSGTWRYWHELPSLTVIAVLRDADEARLVDESLAMTATVGEPPTLAESYERTWDTLALDLSAASSADVNVGPSVFALQPATTIDGVVQLPQADEGSLFRDSFVCFSATSGSVPVVGAPLTYQWEGEDATIAIGGAIEAFPFVDAPCVAIPEGSGTRQITIAGPGVEQTFEITLRTADGAFRGALPSAGRDGERAGG
ncbi:MAG: hypothetical protein H6720_27800 [Sandaracinus sp.]|nr:hypothetical protein [Sandaracinus sp.]